MPNPKKDDILLSRFLLKEFLGRGGMGEVWRAGDLELQVDIAVKVLYPHLAQDPDRIALLKNECRNTRRLVHPHIVRTFDFHRLGDLAFISMDYIRGEDLAAYGRRSGSFSYAEMISLLLPIVDALSYAHGLGIVHRDIKSGNILIDTKGDTWLADFGISSAAKTADHHLHLSGGGTLYAMSPQQLRGQAPHPSDDLYALGVLMYDLLTGHPPFYPNITPEKIEGEIPLTVNGQLKQMNTAQCVPDSLDTLIEKLMAKDPRNRPASSAFVGNELQRIMRSGQDGTMPPRIIPPTEEKTRPSTGGLEEIAKREFVAGPSGRTGHGPRHHTTLKALALFILMAGVLLAGGFWLNHLSKNPVIVSDVPLKEEAPQIMVGQKPFETSKEESAPDAVERDPSAASERERKTAEEKLADFLEAVRMLNDKGGNFWGGALYDQITSLGQEADALFIKEAYVAASAKYEEALTKTKQLFGLSGTAWHRLIGEGRTALAEGDGKRAQKKFQVALMIDPENDSIRRELEKAEKIERVLALIASGRDHERENNFPFALADYQEAMELDPEYEEARAAVERVKNKIAHEEFQRLMSSGFEALHDGNYDLARAKFLQARSFKPDAPEIKDALAQVEQAIALAKIRTLKEKALQAESSEGWEDALASYEEVLKIDPAVQFAVQGKTRSMEQMRIRDEIRFYLENPEAMDSNLHLHKAVRVLQEASALQPRGPKIKALTADLNDLVEIAKTPVKVILESDNLTEVAVYQVGKFGRFREQELNLRPGTYTVVGMREGYKDVRQKITVRDGPEELRFLIVCKERI